MRAEWDEDAADVFDGESSEDDIDNDTDDEADERDNEPGGVAELSLADDEELDDNDFSVDLISDIDTDTVGSEDIPQKNSKSYKEVGDNLDKNIKPNFQRISHQTKSVYYFHTFAVRDQIDFSDLSESVPHSN